MSEERKRGRLKDKKEKCKEKRRTIQGKGKKSEEKKHSKEERSAVDLFSRPERISDRGFHHSELVKREILKLAIIEQRALVAKNIIRFELESYDADKLTLPTSKPLKRNSNAESLGEIDSVTEGGGQGAGSELEIADRWRVRCDVGRTCGFEGAST